MCIKDIRQPNPCYPIAKSHTERLKDNAYG